MRHDNQDNSKTLGELVDASRRRTAVDLVAFACLFKDIAEQSVAPWALTIQSNTLEPWVMARAQQRHSRLVREQADGAFWLRALLRVITLLRQHSPMQDLVNLVRAAFYATPAQLFPVSAAGVQACWGRRYPAFLIGLQGFLSGDDGAGPRFRGVDLQVITPVETDKDLL